MKKIISLILALFLIFTLTSTALADKGGNPGGPGKPEETGNSNGDQHGKPGDPGKNNASPQGCLHGEPDNPSEKPPDNPPDNHCPPGTYQCGNGCCNVGVPEESSSGEPSNNLAIASSPPTTFVCQRIVVEITITLSSDQDLPAGHFYLIGLEKEKLVIGQWDNEVLNPSDEEIYLGQEKVIFSSPEPALIQILFQEDGKNPVVMTIEGNTAGDANVFYFQASGQNPVVMAIQENTAGQANVFYPGMANHYTVSLP